MYIAASHSSISHVPCIRSKLSENLFARRKIDTHTTEILVTRLEIIFSGKKEIFCSLYLLFNI